ncbi:hypothetical protein BN946_scf184999.g2 [Trametes cinnabarina]|uniref:Uncharacterized protein n=1 Tax=Pycnoporus cinnabarinus TaxID=5643 RepID=A0A060S7C0_PYCCI|nr:hypothetical protein BN946_scf184999.g2 [Trametes cinnabarina]
MAPSGFRSQRSLSGGPLEKSAVEDTLTYPKMTLASGSLPSRIGDQPEKTWPPARSKRKRDDARAKQRITEEAAPTPSPIAEQEPENPYTKVLNKLDELFEGRYGSSINKEEWSETGSHETLTAPDPKPSPTRVLLSKIKELGQRVDVLEEHDRTREEEWAAMKGRVEMLARQHSGFSSMERRLDSIEREIRSLNECMNTAEVGEQTQQELYDMYESLQSS